MWPGPTWICYGHRFPIQEYGLNYAAQPLQKHEIKAMTKDETVMRRIVTSYKLMLDFYGMRLESEATGLIVRSTNYAAQYRNLCSTFVPRLDLVLQSRPEWTDASCRALYETLHGLEILSDSSAHFVYPMTSQ